MKNTKRMRIRSFLYSVITIIMTEGIKGLWLRGRRRFVSLSNRGGGVGIIEMLSKVDVIKFYGFVLERNVDALPGSATSINNKSINWLIPDFGIGSGGHLNIFRYISLLEKRGYKNTICIVGSHRHASTEDAKNQIAEHFLCLQANVVFGVESLAPAYFSFATGWTTAYALKGFGNTVRKFYFVQDFEPAFYAHGSEYDFAEATYKFGFVGVCAGSWLSEKLTADYGMQCYSLGFSYDRELYVQTLRREPKVRRVFCYCRPPTLRRGLETALLALNLVGEQMPDVKFIFAGWDMGGYYFPHEHLNAGVLSLKELPDLYSQCDVGLVISFTNLSLLPLELMACGCVVVTNRGKNSEWLINDSNSVLSDSSPVAIAEAIVSILHDSARRAKLIAQAKEFANTTSWEAEADKMCEILKQHSSAISKEN